jgi:hypothetical protein
MEQGMSIKVKLLESVGEIESKVLSSLAIQFNSTMKSNKSKILNEIKALIGPWISMQPEVQSLLVSDPTSLVGQFGITISPSSIVNAIISSIVNTTTISVTPYDKKLKGGGLDINIQPDNFVNLLALPQGHSLYSGGDLHWLDWLINRGDEVIIIGYQYNPGSGLGRSRLGNMIPGKAFRVPPQFSGTQTNNFITRALIGPSQDQQISKILQKILSA